MKKVSIYVENARLTPSSYYRLTQYFQPSEARFHSALPDCVYRWWHSLGKKGRQLFSIPLYVLYVFRTLFFLIGDNLSMSNGTVILARAIVPRRLPFLHKYLIRRLAKRNKIAWDFDDNILANKRISPVDFHFYSEHSDTIVVSTDILLSLVDKCFAHKVKILPTTDGDFLGCDTEKVLSQRQLLYNEEIRLVWVATALGLDYIQPIIPSLDDAAKTLKELTGKKLTLHVVCNKPLLAETSCLEIVNIHWNREIAKKEIISSHIGLMPLPDDEFTRGKGGFKLIQYMSTAMPVIASSVGFNKQIVTKDFGYLINSSNDQTTNSPNDQTTWKDAIIELASDWDSYARMSRNAKDCYNKGFAFDKNKKFWEHLTCKATAKSLLMVVNEDRFFLSHRKDIAIAAQKEGFNVKIVCKDTGQRQDVENLSLEMIELPVNPTGSNPLEEIRTFLFLMKLYRKLKPDIVHHVGLKCILWGGLAARRRKIKSVVNAVSGLGVLFSDDGYGLTTRMAIRVMRYSCNRGHVVQIFQNHEDMKLFQDLHIASKEQCEFIKGSGVNLTEYAYTPEPATRPVRVVLSARMVREKGIITFIKAAEILRDEMQGKVVFILCGGLSNNPKGIKEHELRKWCDGKYIQWLGYRSDMGELLKQSHIVVLPSYYREGVPKSLIEATAIGRPIITTHSYGCKDTVDDGENGFLIPPKDAAALAEKLRILINDGQLREQMGMKGRQKAELEFSLDHVVDHHLEIYRKVSNPNNIGRQNG